MTNGTTIKTDALPSGHKILIHGEVLRNLRYLSRCILGDNKRQTTVPSVRGRGSGSDRGRCIKQLAPLCAGLVLVAPASKIELECATYHVAQFRRDGAIPLGHGRSPLPAL